MEEHRSPVGSPGRPQKPLGMTPAAREVWDYTVEQMERMGTLTLADRDPLRIYCELVAKVAESAARLAQPGLSESERMRENRAQLQAANLAKGWARELGMTPSARMSMDLSAGAEDGELEDWMRR